MTIIRRVMFSLLLISLAIGYAQAATRKKTQVIVGQGSMMSKQKPLAKFNAINASGDMQIKMIASTSMSDIRIIGEQNIVDHVVAKVVNNTLFLRMDNHYNYQKMGRLVAIVRARHINQITYHGKGNLTAIGLNSPAMNLTLDTSGRVNLSGKIGIDQLNLDGSGVINIKGLRSYSLDINTTGSDVVNLIGMADLRELNFSGKGWLSIYWVNSPKLTIHGTGNAYVQLGGKVGTLNVQLKEHAYLNAHYLRTEKVFVKTHDFSRADLQISDVQNALAKGQSNIYYYTTPVFHADYMAHYGSVLNFGDLH